MEKVLLLAIASAWSPPISVLLQKAYFVQVYVWMCIIFEKLFLKPIASAGRPPLTVLSRSAYFVQLYVWMCIMFWKTSTETHCFCLKPTTHSTFAERILCSIVCLNVYNVLKNFFWNPLLLLEAHHSVYFHRVHFLFNCMFENVKCFEKFLLEAIASAWSPPPTVLSRSAHFVQLYSWRCIMFWKTSSETHCFCLKPTTQCTFTRGMFCSSVCLNVYNVSKNFFWKTLLVFEAQQSLYFHRVQTFFNCLFGCVKYFEKILLKTIASDGSPPLTVLSQSAFFVQLYVWICKMFWKISSGSHCFCLKPTNQCTSTERMFWSVVCLHVNTVWKKTSSASHCFCLKPTTLCTFTEGILCSSVCLKVYNVLKNFFLNPLFLLEAHHSLYLRGAHSLFNCMFECV